MTQVPDLAQLASETRWLRALARSLVADVHLADDLAQDALAAALEHGGPVRAWRAFFATALRRRLFEHRRERAARVDGERKSARREALPSTLEMVERAGIQRDLVQAVLELEEPYRTAILWRFFEELAPREIARRSGAPVATVHTRIQRGLARLRERLTRGQGGQNATQRSERDWALALLPLLAPPPSAALVPVAPLLGVSLKAILMKASTQLALLVLVLAGGALATWRLQRSATPAARADLVASARAAAPLDPPRVEPAPPDEPAREAVAPAPERGAPAPTAPAPAPERARRLVAGLALDPLGRGLAGVELAALPSDERFRSGGGGRFTIEVDAGARTIVSADERWATALAGVAATTTETGAVVVLAPRLALARRAQDAAGNALAGAELGVQLPAAFGADFGFALDGAMTQAWSAVSAADGVFQLADVPGIEGARLTVRLGGFETLDEALPGASRTDMVLTLARVHAVAELVRGVVLKPDASPAAGARVAFGLATTLADARGRFELAAENGEQPARVQALLAGFQAACVTREELGGAWPAELTLRLGGAPLAISGRVVRSDGVPVPSAKVWLAPPTWFGGIEGDVTSVEALTARDDRRFWAWVAAQGDGSFELAGLSPRTYRLKAVDPDSLLLVESEPIPAGTREVRLVLPSDALHARVRGRVVASDGAGIPDLRVQVQRMALEFAFPGGGTRDEFTTRAPVATDADGRFELMNVPREGVEIFATGDAILFAGAWLGPESDPEGVVIRAERRVHVQIELAPPFERADALRVLDEKGQGLVLRVMRGSTSFTNPRAELLDGRSHVLSVSERARWVVLYRGEAEVARLAVTPAPSGVNLVRW